MLTALCLTLLIVAPYISLANEAVNFLKSLRGKVENLIIITGGNQSQEMKESRGGESSVTIPPSLMKVDGYKWQILAFISTYAKKGIMFSVAKDGAGVFQAEAVNDGKPKIPLVIHQTWKTKKLYTYSRVAMRCRNHITPNAPEFYSVMWDDDEIKRLVLLYYPTYKKYFESLNMNIKRADLARYMILHKFGGLYMDLDVDLRSPVLSVLKPDSYGYPEFITYKSKEFSVGKTDVTLLNFAGNAFIASVPGSPILMHMVEFAIKFKDQTTASTHGVLSHTGPVALGQVLGDYIKTFPKSDRDLFDSSYMQLSSTTERGLLNYSYWTSPRIRILHYSLVGNEEDNATIAVHLRQASWRYERKEDTNK